MTDAISNDDFVWAGAVEATNPEPPRSTGSRRRRVPPWPEPSALGADKPASTLASQLIGLTAIAARKLVRDRNRSIDLREVGSNDVCNIRISGITLVIRNGRVINAFRG